MDDYRPPNGNYEVGYSFIKYRATLITERGNDRPWLFETGWMADFELDNSNDESFTGIVVIPECPQSIIIDAICTFELKFYRNCGRGCNRIKKNRLDITIKGACEHLNMAREEFVSRGEDYFIISGDRAYKHNSANYDLDFTTNE